MNSSLPAQKLIALSIITLLCNAVSLHCMQTALHATHNTMQINTEKNILKRKRLILADVHAAVATDSLEDVQNCINNGADLNDFNIDLDESNTPVGPPLMNARSIEMAQLLVAHGAKLHDQYVRTGCGKLSLLNFLRQHGRQDIAVFLKQNGANEFIPLMQ